jgi:hypothetical protein
MPSGRENIMANLLTAIQAINGAPTYTYAVTTDKVVSREPLEIVELSRAAQLPAALLQEDTQDFDYHFEQSSGLVPADLTMSTFKVTVLALLEKRGGVNTALNAWLADILKAVMVDITRGGAAFDTMLVSIGPPRENRIVPDDLAAAEMQFAVKYIHTANTL